MLSPLSRKSPSQLQSTSSLQSSGTATKSSGHRSTNTLPPRTPLAQLFNTSESLPSTSISVSNSGAMAVATSTVGTTATINDSESAHGGRKRLARRRSSTTTSTVHSSPAQSDENSSSATTMTPSNSATTTTCNKLYDNLATYSFGSPGSSASYSKAQLEAISPFASSRGPEFEDDDDRIRSERAKMRAIDDGTRRPSLPSNIPENDLSIYSDRRPSQPINIPRSNQSASQQEQPAASDDHPQNSTSTGTIDSFDTVPEWPQSPTPSPPPPTQDALAGFDLDYIMSAGLSPTVRQNSIAQLMPSSFLSPSGSGSQNGNGFYPGRRPSTASALSDGQNDTFFRHIYKNDVEYTDRRKEWSFRRKPPAPSTPKDKHPSIVAEWQMWECFMIGRFTVARCKTSKDDSSDKPLPQRLLIHPHSSSSTQSGTQPKPPTSLIHKHSRANAFSIFRNNKLRTMHMSASQSVLLAPLKVQVHYTETKSTRALRTYDFFQNDRCSETGSNDRRSHSFGSQSPTPRSPTPVASQPIASGSGSSPHHRRELPPLNSAITPLEEEDEDDDMGTTLRSNSRKSHADAMGKLDEKQLEAHRQAKQAAVQHHPVPVPVSVNQVRHSRFGTALKKAFAVVPPTSAHGATDETNGIYNPPWITLPPRAQQERNERTLHQLNKSFEDVGLLPHRKKPSGSPSSNTAAAVRRAATSARRHVHEAFEEVPVDSPVMLLPMWACDESSQTGSPSKGKSSATSTPLPERRYLLISYLPLPPAAGNGKNLKRARSAVVGRGHERVGSSGDGQGKDGDRDGVLKSFKVIAKVLSYEDVRTSGLRLPNEGIEVSQVASSHELGNRSIPPPLSNFGDTVVIAICPSAESGIEFVPEGLDKLGLCYRAGDLPISSIADPMERERLSPVGKAIVEMAWCGCLSVMGLCSSL